MLLLTYFFHFLSHQQIVQGLPLFLANNQQYLSWCQYFKYFDFDCPLPSEWLLTELKLLQEVGQELHQGLVSHTTLHHIGCLVGTGHDLDPRLVNVAETFGFLFGA